MYFVPRGTFDHTNNNDQKSPRVQRSLCNNNRAESGAWTTPKTSLHHNQAHRVCEVSKTLLAWSQITNPKGLCAALVWLRLSNKFLTWELWDRKGGKWRHVTRKAAYCCPFFQEPTRESHSGWLRWQSTTMALCFRALELCMHLF